MPIQTGIVRMVGTGNNCNDPVNGLQAQINAATLGDTVVIPAGATCVGNYTLKNKSVGSGWIVIRSSSDNQLPEHVRVTPTDVSKMAKVVAPKVGSYLSSPVFKTEQSAHHYRLLGLEMTPALAATLQYDAIVDLGNQESGLAALPSDIVIDRCYIHGHANWEGRRGVKMNSKRTAVIDSYISDVHQLGYDTQAIGAWNGPGPFKIVNNYLEASGENVMFGGATPNVPNLIAEDIEIRGNHFYKPFWWKLYKGNTLPSGPCAFDASRSTLGEMFQLLDTSGAPISAYQCNGGVWQPVPSLGRKWTVKNSFELKSARRVIVDGNIFENTWADAQQGWAILMQGMPSDSGTWAVVEDVQFSNNIIRRAAGGVNLCGGCIYSPAQTTDPNMPNYADAALPRVNRLKISSNVFEGISQYLGYNFNYLGILLQILNGSANITVVHNTAFPGNQILNMEGSRKSQGVYIVDNIINHGPRVITCSGAGGNYALDKCIAGWTMTNNVFVAPPSSVNKQFPYPSGNMYPTSYDEIKFVNFNNGSDGDYHLASGSQFKSRGTDGTDIGVDMDAVGAATVGVIRGSGSYQ